MIDDDRPTPSPGLHHAANPITLDDVAQRMTDGFSRVLSDVATTNGNVRSLRTEVHEAVERIDRLEVRVFGSKVPPLLTHATLHAPVHAPTSTERRAPSMTNELADAHDEIAEVKGRLLTLEAIAKQQSRSMGLAMPDASTRERFGKFFKSREGIKLTMGALFAILLSVVSTIGAVAANRAAEHAHEVAK